MFRTVWTLGIALALAAGVGRAEDKKDADTKVAAGAEVTLAAVEVTAEKDLLDDGRAVAVVKTGKETKVKMPAQAWTLGFTGEAAKDGGIKVADLAEATALVEMRTEAGMGDGIWRADPGDVITHANGFAVKTFEDLLAAVSTAKKPEDVQLVVKDVNSGKSTIFYVTAMKR